MKLLAVFLLVGAAAALPRDVVEKRHLANALDLEKRAVANTLDVEKRAVPGALELEKRAVAGALELEKRAVAGALELEKRAVPGALELERRAVAGALELEKRAVPGALELEKRKVPGALELEKRAAANALDLEKRDSAGTLEKSDAGEIVQEPKKPLKGRELGLSILAQQEKELAEKLAANPPQPPKEDSKFKKVVDTIDDWLAKPKNIAEVIGLALFYPHLH